MTPLTMVVLGGMINEYGHSIPSNETVNEYFLNLLYLAIGVGISAFVEGVCWTTAERQTSRMRIEYLKSVLRQDVGYFDNQDAASTTFQVISTISSDAHLIQDTTAEKIPNCLAQLSSFFISLGVAFSLSWSLTVAALPFSVLFIVPAPALGFGMVLKHLGSKSNGAYRVAGGIAEQAISSIRTVYSYVRERQTLDRFSSALQKSMELGVKQGLIKGMLIGSMGMVYANWAFQAWIGSIITIERGEQGGLTFACGICVIWGGLSIMNVLPNLSFILEATSVIARVRQHP
ncbi:hypothetical protein CerSpe_025490 [Prunus speciosa]